MKNKFLLLLILCFPGLTIIAQGQPSVHSYTALSINGTVVNLSDYSGKKIMLVNTASYCAYTPQFAQLEELYKGYKQYGFEILGFPCNDFGNQDPGKDSAINVFCTSNYGVSFRMMSKINIISGDTSPVYKWLQRANLNGLKNNVVDWNFNKFLINESGNLVTHYTSTVSPLDSKIKNWIHTPPVVSGIEQLQNDGRFVKLISSNPASSFIELQIGKSSDLPYLVTLFSIDGKVQKNFGHFFIPKDEKINLDLATLDNGVYFLNVRNGEAFGNFRIVILE